MNKDHLRSRPDFGKNIFDKKVMVQHIPAIFYDRLEQAISNHQPISRETADVIAQAMKQWALTNGATHYTHWFQPLTGATAEKHQSFLDLDSEGQPIDSFSGKQLIMDEPDASSFPHGGLRSTFEARGYTSWDPSSPAFLQIIGKSIVLCLPSVFVSYTGEVLGQKNPLLRSMIEVDKAGVRLLKLLGVKGVQNITPYVGAEQEYFLVDRELYSRRSDLQEVKSTLSGVPLTRGQELNHHYFGTISERVLNFMEELESNLSHLGVMVKARHNEVAPNQFELAVMHMPANIAADQNHIIMEALARIAPHHNLEVLLHEKPFAGINGSGKHNNWSLIDSMGTNMFEPGKNQSSQLRFLVFLLALLLAVKKHRYLLHCIITSPGNDLRLGGSEAPPKIISVYLGKELLDQLNRLAEGDNSQTNNIPREINLGLRGIASIPQDSTDRNRTAPIAFTGNKFEFRMLGSSSSISLPNTVINAMMTESLHVIADGIEASIKSGLPKTDAIIEVIRNTIKETIDCCFNGDCYSDEWALEATQRGLMAKSNTAEALDELISEQSIALFTNYGILTDLELRARHQIRLQTYADTVEAELKILRQMVTTQILPAAFRYQTILTDSINSASSAMGSSQAALESQRHWLANLMNLIDQLLKHRAILDQDLEQTDRIEDLRERAVALAGSVRPHMGQARAVVDQLEKVVEADLWPLPVYSHLLTLK